MDDSWKVLPEGNEDGDGASPAGAGSRFQIAEVSPSLAAEMLASALTRYDDPKAIATYAQAMAAESWIMNGQPIIFDQHGRLIDGVQRLAACIKADRPFITAIARNVRADTLHTIDQHRRRTYQGVLDARGLADSGSLQRTMSKLIRIENGTLGRESLSISWSRFDRVLDANPELLEAVALANKFAKTSLHSTARPVLCFMAIKAGKQVQLQHFLHQLGDIWTEGIDNPARLFNFQLESWAESARRERQLGKSGAGEHVDSVLAHAILYFNAFCSGQRLHKPLSWVPDYGPRRSGRAPLSPEGDETLSDRSAAPANLGLPIMEGYPGLAEGNVDRSRAIDELSGRTAETIHLGASGGAGQAAICEMTVTPELAAKWLHPSINRSNRKTQSNHVRAISRDIVNGNWMMNAQPICFHGDPFAAEGTAAPPRLLNGQHRLLAIRDAGIAIEVPIAIHIPLEAFSTFDVHAKRTLRRAGPKGDDRVLAAAARFQSREESGIALGSNEGPSLTTSELMQVLNRHPGLQASFPRSRTKGMMAIGSAGVMTYFIYRVQRESPVLGAEFLDKIETGLNIADPSDPAGKLRRDLANQPRGARGRSRKELIEALIGYWNNYLRWSSREPGPVDRPRVRAELRAPQGPAF